MGETNKVDDKKLARRILVWKISVECYTALIVTAVFVILLTRG